MNLEIVPCMFKSRLNDGNESQFVGLIVRTPDGKAMAAIPPNTTTTTNTCQTKSTPGIKGPLKLQPKPNNTIPITPKILPNNNGNNNNNSNIMTSTNMTSTIMSTTTSTTTTNVTLTSNNGTLGVGSVFELPLSAINQGGTVNLTINKSTTNKKSSKQKLIKSKESKNDNDTISSANSSRSSIDLQSPTQIQLTDQQSSYIQLPPISSINPVTTNNYQNLSTTNTSTSTTTTECTVDDIRAIDIAHDLHNEHEMNRNNSTYWTRQNDSAAYYHHHQNPDSYIYQQQPGTSYHDNNYHNNNNNNNNNNDNTFNHHQSNNYSNFHQNNHQQQWVNQQQQQRTIHYGPNNQMTSSTPDSGIQSIDGSPPSSSAFTPPMVSPYAVQNPTYDHGLGGLPSTTLHPPNNQIQQSHVQLPPLNFNKSTQQQQQIHQLNHQQSQQQQQNYISSTTSTNINTVSYLDQQQPSCSHTTNSTKNFDDFCNLENITVQPIDGVPELNKTNDDNNDEDSDIDYSEMPTLIRADDSNTKIVLQKDDSPMPDRTESRIDNDKDNDNNKKIEETLAINSNMNPDEIAKQLLSSLTADKILEVLKHIPSANSIVQAINDNNNNNDFESNTTTTTVLKETIINENVTKLKSDKKEKKKKSSLSRPSSSAGSKTPPPTIERPQTRNSNKSIVRPNSSLKQQNITAIKKDKKEKEEKEIKIKERKERKVKKNKEEKKNGRVKTKNSPKKIEKKSKKITKKVIHKDQITIVALKKHPYSNFHHYKKSISKINNNNKENVSKYQPKMLSMCDNMDNIIHSLSIIHKPSNLLKSRYENVANNLAILLEKTHLKIPKVNGIRWEPSGSWKSCFETKKKRKSTDNKNNKIIPNKKIKKDNKTCPLKISINSTTSTSTNTSTISSRISKKKHNNILTPISKDDYIKIRSNVLIEAPIKLSLASKQCDCTDKDPCTSTSNCITRNMYTECTQYSCILYFTCQNRKIQNNEGVHQLQLFKKNYMNNGVRSLVDISKGQLVTEYVGEIIRKDTYFKRLENNTSYPNYAVELIPGSYVIDSSKKGNLSRFMNHSCSPNCIMQRWVVNGQQRIGIFALEDIESGVELTYDYSMHVHTSNNEIKCLCGSDNCKGIIPSMPPPNKAPNKPNKLSEKDLSTIKNGHVFLKRNILKYKQQRNIIQLKSTKYLTELSICLSKILNDFINFCKKEQIPRRWLNFIVKNCKNTFNSLTKETKMTTFLEIFDTAVKHSLSIICKSVETKKMDILQQQYLLLKRQSNIYDIMKDEQLSEAVLGFLAERKKPSTKKAEHSPKIISAVADLTYMDSTTSVGSYNPDENTSLNTEAEDNDSVRCICGIMDEGGMMCQCDKCHYWLHGDCLGIKKEIDGEFICLYCKNDLKSTPLLDIPLIPQPDYAFDKCVYYRTLVNCRGIQARVNECVYMEKIINDEYKKSLKKFNEEYVDGKPVTKKKKKLKNDNNLLELIQEPPKTVFRNDVERIYHRKDLRVFRIVRLFKVPTGERFAFGCYYARPHETFVDSTRMFFKNELFVTPLFDTLPVDAIVGRCLVLEPSDYSIGRPKGPKYDEEDVYICEYAIDRNQKQFEKLTEKNRYQINTAHYLFDRFDKPLSMKRNFTPFIVKDKVGRSLNNEKNPKIKLSTVVKDTSSKCLNRIIDDIIKIKNDCN